MQLIKIDNKASVFINHIKNTYKLELQRIEMKIIKGE